MKQLVLSLLLLLYLVLPAQQSFGLDYADEEYDAMPMKATLTRSLYDDIPVSASLKAYCPPVGEQQFNDCVGWASSYAARSILFNQKYHRTGDKVAIFSPTYLHRSVATNCGATAVTEKALSFLKEVGTVPAQLLAYDCMENIPADSLKKWAATFRISEYEKLFSKDEQNAKTKLLKVKKALAESRPVIIGMDVYKSFMGAKGLEVWTPVMGDQLIAGHAMVVVSYDDTKEGGAFEIMNSWGDDWGQKGFLWVKYAHFAAHVKRAYTMVIDNSDNKEEEVYDGMPKADSIFDWGKVVPAPPVPASESIARLSSFSGSFRLITIDNTEMAVTNTNKEEGMNIPNSNLAQIQVAKQGIPFYTTEKSYKNGTCFRIYAQNKQTAYVYVLSLDVNDHISCLFPYEKDMSPRLDYAQNEIALPDEDYFIELGNPIGDEWMCVLYSKSKLNIESTMSEIAKTSGNLLERVEKVFGESCVKAEDVQYDEDKAAFNAKISQKMVVPLVIKMKHVE